MNQTASKSVLRFSLGTRAKVVVTKKIIKNYASDISPICRDAATGAIGLNFGVLGHIAEVITHAKFCDNRFRGFEVLIPPILAILYRNSWSPLQQCKHYRATL